MFFRSEKLLIPLEKPAAPDPNGAAAIQELLGGKFGEMSTLNNYLHQSFGFKEKKKLKPFYDLVASITAEELGHVELITTAINLMLEGSYPEGEPVDAPGLDAANLQKHPSHHRRRRRAPGHGFHGTFLERRARLLIWKPRCRPFAQLLSGDRCPDA